MREHKKTIVAFGQEISDEVFLAVSKKKEREKKELVMKARKRRYKLHAIIKCFCQIKPKSRLILLTQEIYDTCATDQRAALDELCQKFKYNLQFEIV